MLLYKVLYEHVADYHNAVRENSYRKTEEACAAIAHDIEGNLPGIISSYQQEDLTNYKAVLKRYGVNLEAMELKDAYIENMDIPGILALLLALVRADHFAEGTLIYYTRNAVVMPWLERLKMLDVLKSIEDAGKAYVEFDSPYIHVVVSDITKMKTDCVVNAANTGLKEGGGVCGAIFQAAGSKELKKACDKYGYCKTGQSVYTPGFNLPAKYIIHSVGPKYEGGRNGEDEKLAGCYRSALYLMESLGCHSISFPLISSGIYGYPKEEAWKVALESCIAYLHDRKNKQETIQIYFTVLDDEAKILGQKTLENYYNHYWSMVLEKYLGIMDIIANDPVLSVWTQKVSPYSNLSERHDAVLRWVEKFDDDCLSSAFGLMPEQAYAQVVNDLGEDEYAGAVLSIPAAVRAMNPSQLRAGICQYIRAHKFTGDAIYIGAGNGAFYMILNEWLNRNF